MDETKISFVSINNYAESVALRGTGSGKIAVIYADGDVVMGKGQNEAIASDDYRALLQKIRNDKSIDAVVLRVNSPGGSALASDIIWREIDLLKKEKPVVVSMGDVAASGGYYIACGADSIFADANTITGSIGVFSVIPNAEKFLKNKVEIIFNKSEIDYNQGSVNFISGLSILDLLFNYGIEQSIKIFNNQNKINNK